MALQLQLHAPPKAVRLDEGPLQRVADQNAAAREQAAFAEGHAQGQAAAVNSGAAALTAALVALDEKVERAEQELAHHAVEIGVEIASALVRARIEAGDYDLERIVRGALADSGVGRGEVTVHLNPDDRAALDQASFRTGTLLEVDPTLPRGDVHLSTPRGLLVREVGGTLESIREQLLEDLA
jgi:flagellar biosynthesis/type III secretory pathway protein FliH